LSFDLPSPLRENVNNTKRKDNIMQKLIPRMLIVSMCVAGLVGLAAGCCCTKSGAAKEVDVTLAAVSAPARATIEKETAGGRVDKITREVERGKTVYDVEATVGGKHMEYLVADATGELLGTEAPVEVSSVPQPVQDAAQKYFGTTTGLTVMKGVEYGETHYEVEGLKNNKKVEVTFEPDGKEGK
jgi:uncharacterized membrane protein YkoI